jgi:cytoskeletal protein RodZ
VSIGDALAEARRQAGLTITQVSQRTCIRETIIRGIERDDFSACGGDFYARGHIRSIARAAGLAPEPLIREYDSTQGSPQGITAADVFEPSAPIKMRERRRPNWGLAMLVALAALVAAAAYHWLAGPARTSPAAGQRPAAAQPAGRKPAPGSTPTGTVAKKPRSRESPKHKIVITLSAVTSSCWVELTSIAGQVIFEQTIPVGTSMTWTEHHAIRLSVGDPGAVTLTVDGRSQAPPVGTAATLSPADSTPAAG